MTDTEIKYYNLAGRCQSLVESWGIQAAKIRRRLDPTQRCDYAASLHAAMTLERAAEQLRLALEITREMPTSPTSQTAASQEINQDKTKTKTHKSPTS